jgi:exodeoxyribonuclease-3
MPLEATAKLGHHPLMKIVSWNVNSLNVRLPHVLSFLEQEQPDVLALQEMKLTDDKFPLEAIHAAGYQAVFAGQKTYNGVCLLTRQLATDIITDIPELNDPQRRLLAASVDSVRIINVYIPNGQAVGSDKYAYKFRWLQAFRTYLETELAQHEKLIVLGDFNIAPADCDVHDPGRWHEKIMCSTAEREWFQSLLDFGLTDTVRSMHPDEPMHSWWDYRMNAFRRQWGIRIDHVLSSAALSPFGAGVAKHYRELERPSDHAPVWVEFEEGLLAEV